MGISDIVRLVGVRCERCEKMTLFDELTVCGWCEVWICDGCAEEHECGICPVCGGFHEEGRCPEEVG